MRRSRPTNQRTTHNAIWRAASRKPEGAELASVGTRLRTGSALLFHGGVDMRRVPLPRAEKLKISADKLAHNAALCCTRAADAYDATRPNNVTP